MVDDSELVSKTAKALISDDLNNTLNQIVGYGYLLNRVVDRDLSIIGVRYSMSYSANIIHLQFSHKFPLLSDLVYDYQASRNNETVYPATPAGDKDYNNLVELFDDLLNLMIEYEKAVAEGIEQADNENDYTTKKFLEDFLIELHNYTSQVISFYDRAIYYQGDYMSFDRDIKKFFTLKDEVLGD